MTLTTQLRPPSRAGSATPSGQAREERVPKHPVAEGLAGPLPTANARVRASRQLGYQVVRQAVQKAQRRRLEARVLPTAEACLAALPLGWKPLYLKGDKLAVCLVNAESSRAVAAAICSRPMLSRLNDGLTVELRCFVAAPSLQLQGRLAEAICGHAAQSGYRRLVVAGGRVPPDLPIAGRWERVVTSCTAEQAIVWACVLRGDWRLA